MSKKKNSQKRANEEKVSQPATAENDEQNISLESAETLEVKQETDSKKDSKKEKVVEVKAKDVKKKKEKQKKPNKVAKALKDTGNELKKVEWPKFKQVVKQTSVVLVFVIIFALVLFGFDRLCSWLTSLLV